MKLKLFFFSLLYFIPGLAMAVTPLSSEERTEIRARLERFRGAKATDPTPMFYRTPKYDPVRRQFVHPNARLRLPEDQQPSDPMLNLAQRKATREFQKYQCETVLKPQLPNADCRVPLSRLWAEVEKGDTIEEFLQGWIPKERVVRALDEIPVTGETALPLWSDDYWRTVWGGTSYRYADPVKYETYELAIAAYAQPDQWRGLYGTLSLPELASKVLRWSPAEKYDLLVGDDAFTLTNQQKAQGKDVKDEKGVVQPWMGICHGWAPASMMAPRSLKSVTLTGTGGLSVTWHPAEIRALLSLSWANGNYNSQYAGGRCDAKEARAFPNGRLQQQACFDTNPSTFHLALGNLIGKEKKSFVMDKSFDHEVWNQPLQSYEFTYFNPLNPELTSKNWREVMVSYDDAFKKADRFQHPLTRGVRRGGAWDDTKVAKIVGVMATVSYAGEISPPEFQPEAEEDYFLRETYTYDLELTETGGALIPTGGEWHENAHPDFLWVPDKDSVAAHEEDDTSLVYKGDSPSPTLTSVAKVTSASGFPVCRVMKELVRLSAATGTYQCVAGETEPPPPPPPDDCHSLPPAPMTLVVQVAYPETQIQIDGRDMGDFRAGTVRTFTSSALDPCADSLRYRVTLTSWKLVQGSYYWLPQEVTVPVKAAKESRVYLAADGSYTVDGPRIAVH